MAEFFLPFLIGYFTSRILAFMLRSNSETSVDPESVLLKWDNSIFGWRTVADIREDSTNQRYMVARPVPSEFVSSLIEFRKKRG